MLFSEGKREGITPLLLLFQSFNMRFLAVFLLLAVSNVYGRFFICKRLHKKDCASTMFSCLLAGPATSCSGSATDQCCNMGSFRNLDYLNLQDAFVNLKSQNINKGTPNAVYGYCGTDNKDATADQAKTQAMVSLSQYAWCVCHGVVHSLSFPPPYIVERYWIVLLQQYLLRWADCKLTWNLCQQSRPGWLHVFDSWSELSNNLSS